MALDTGLKLLFITLLKLLQNTSATDIQNVTSTGMIASPYAHSGVVTVKFQDVWGYVCYYGSKKRWGKREATTVCKQLGYMGGWPTMRDEIERSTHNLYNVDCDDGLNDLNNCNFDIISDCERSTIAGIQCYDSFQIKLAGGKTQNIGRVQVKYDDVVSDVCYSQDNSITWEFYNTQVFCRELGYTGAMFDREASDNYEMDGSTISGYECRDDLKEASLQDCYPDLPYQQQQIGREACKGIIASCAVPGYVGCFDNRKNELQTSFNSANMTINQCRHYCRNEVFRYAFLSRGDTCACSTDIIGNPVSDKLCSMICFGDGDLVCGDNSTSSVYDVKLGTCDDPLDGNSVYFFGEVFTKDCKSRSEVSIQCILSNDTGEVAWSAFEECSGRKIWLAIVPFALLLACCALFCFRYKHAHQHDECNNDAGTNLSDAQDIESTEMRTVAQDTEITEPRSDDKSESSVFSLLRPKRKENVANPTLILTLTPVLNLKPFVPS